MADEKFILNVDDDWKRQAQEEKRRLAEQEAKNREPVAPPPAHPSQQPLPTAALEGDESAEPAAFAGLVRTLLTQTMVYLGAGTRQGMPMNMDAARTAVDMLGVLDDKTKGNLSEDEQRLLDTALYQARNQFVAVASQMIGP